MTADQTDDARSDSRPSFAAITSPRLARWVQLVSIGLIVIGLLVLVSALPAKAAEAAMEAVVDWVERLGAFGPLAFVAMYFIAALLMLPVWPLSLVAGMLFGVIGGLLTVLIAATLGMSGTFLIARYAARSFVERKLRSYPRFAAVDKAVGEGGWKVVALLRLSPAVPFNLQNYLYGLTAIRFWPCILTSVLAIMPGTLMFVYLGYAGRAGLAALSDAQLQRGPGQWILLIVGLLATIAVAIYVTQLARRAIREHIHLDDTTCENEGEHESAQQGPVVRRRPWISAGLAALVAILVLIAAVFAQLRRDGLQNVFGPSAMVMVESYKPKEVGLSLGQNVSGRRSAATVGLVRDR